MCIHRFYIFDLCGHHFFALDPLVACYHASTKNGGPLTPIPVTPSTSQYLPITAQMKRVQNSFLRDEVKQVLFASGGQPGCEPTAHPFQTIRLDGVYCGSCREERESRVEQANALMGRVSFNESRWKSSQSRQIDQFIMTVSEFMAQSD